MAERPPLPQNVPEALYTYLKRYQEDPSSRVFAPLSEAYRKAGLIEEALEIAREGLQRHPRFSAGRIALARALFALDRHEEVISEMQALIQDSPDNLAAQKLLADACLALGKAPQALNAYKTLLFFRPGDPECSRMVRELETQFYEGGKSRLILHPEAKPASSPPPPPIGSIPQPPSFVKPGKTPKPIEPSPARQHALRKVEKLQGLLRKLNRLKASSSKSV